MKVTIVFVQRVCMNWVLSTYGVITKVLWPAPRKLIHVV
jgi:hypothetical protein